MKAPLNESSKTWKMQGIVNFRLEMFAYTSKIPRIFFTLQIWISESLRVSVNFHWILETIFIPSYKQTNWFKFRV